MQFNVFISIQQSVICVTTISRLLLLSRHEVVYIDFASRADDNALSGRDVVLPIVWKPLMRMIYYHTRQRNKIPCGSRTAYFISHAPSFSKLNQVLTLSTKT